MNIATRKFTFLTRRLLISLKIYSLVISLPRLRRNSASPRGVFFFARTVVEPQNEPSETYIHISCLAASAGKIQCMKMWVFSSIFMRALWPLFFRTRSLFRLAEIILQSGSFWYSKHPLRVLRVYIG